MLSLTYTVRIFSFSDFVNGLRSYIIFDCDQFYRLKTTFIFLVIYPGTLVPFRDHLHS